MRLNIFGKVGCRFQSQHAVRNFAEASVELEGMGHQNQLPDSICSSKTHFELSAALRAHLGIWYCPEMASAGTIGQLLEATFRSDGMMAIS